ncbi:hypothetical protein EG329_003091 [Mollisiaceae sp. DMI_Dod_QoI]|nr:hypothetical protein EG329_003091 [Helotiales sp. DMI_Dod_QoI]
MGFPTRWDFILDKAKKLRSSDDHEELLDSWSTCIGNAHKKFRAHLGAEETERFAEEQWWKFLFPSSPFPKNPTDWQYEPKPTASVTSLNRELFGSIKQTSRTQTLTIRPGTVNNSVYISCIAFIVDKATKAKISPKLILKNWVRYLQHAEKEFLVKGQAVVQFRAELTLWRHHFPHLLFPGIDPMTGIPSPRTSYEVTRINRQHRARVEDDLVQRLCGIALDRKEANDEQKRGDRTREDSPRSRSGPDRSRDRERKETKRANSRSASPEMERAREYRDRHSHSSAQFRKNADQEHARVEQELRPEDAMDAECDGSD